MVNNGVLLLQNVNRDVFLQNHWKKIGSVMHIPGISLRKEAKSLTGLDVMNVKNGFTCIALT